MKFVLPIVVTTTLLLTACGQKGPLYLPEPSTVVNNDAPESTDTTPTDSAEVDAAQISDERLIEREPDIERESADE